MPGELVQLVGFPPSTFYQTAALALFEKGVSFERINFVLREPSYDDFHPFFKIPVLIDNDMRVFETLAIIDYVDNTRQGQLLLPKDVKNRCLTFEWISSYLDYFVSSILNCSVRERFQKPLMGMEPDDSVIAANIENMKRACLALEKQLGKYDFIGGEQSSAADLFYIPTFLYFIQTPEGADLLKDMPAIKRWMRNTTKKRERKDFLSAIKGHGGKQ